jgi:pyruvate/2-oxoglutarate/acetoin dehydrogenase E1 component
MVEKLFGSRPLLLVILKAEPYEIFGLVRQMLRHVGGVLLYKFANQFNNVGDPLPGMGSTCHFDKAAAKRPNIDLSSIAFLH